jgi:A/G-specific adenine glycosylase
VSGTPDFPPALRDAILDWYGSRARSLPFRGSTDPYAILVSEAMAQQTQAARAGDAWTRFMDRFPTVETLADATPADVLRAWQGLGYNRRALNLWRAARRIVDEFGGRVPVDLTDLESLPGVGPYTARAVAALAFGIPVGAVDTNVRRVLGRIVAGEVGILSPVEVQRLADAAVPVDRAADWTHAVMDVGATLCRPQSPDCAGCPARPWCGYAKSARMPRTQPMPRSKAVREGAAPFPTTSRWLRGRILDRLREARDGEWVVFDSSIGAHDVESVQQAVSDLATEGLVERDTGQSFVVRARLPLA